jgi:hypothetical protein
MALIGPSTGLVLADIPPLNQRPIMSIETSAERAAHRAIGASARAENLKALAELSVTADSSQQADHIRGVVATTMAHLAPDATSATRDSAAQWQKWALGLSHPDAALSP